MITNEEVEYRFTNHPPIEDTGLTLNELTELFVNLGRRLVSLLPESREASLAHTKLEECSMWSKAAVARNQKSL